MHGKLQKNLSRHNFLSFFCSSLFIKIYLFQAATGKNDLYEKLAVHWYTFNIIFDYASNIYMEMWSFWIYSNDT